MQYFILLSLPVLLCLSIIVIVILCFKKKWKVAEKEERNISIDLNVCKRNLAKVKYNQEIRIDVQNMDSKSHSINIEGYIIHEVVGIPSTKMFNGWSYPLVEWQPR